MTRTLRLIVTDTSPLITLALAGSLDLLLRPGVTISIPDAVYVEATRIRSTAGASVIVDWLNAHLAQAHIAPTEIGVDQLRRLEEGRSTWGLGEAAAIETLGRFLDADLDAEALLLFEDSNVMRRRAVVDERIGLISTGDFLRSLEAAGLIRSSDQILNAAGAAGRDVDRQRRITRDAAAIGLLRDNLAGAASTPAAG